MKLNDLTEMTMRTGYSSYESSKNYLPYYQTLKEKGTHCGDIEQFNVFKLNRDDYMDYAVFLDGVCIAFFVLEQNELKVAFVLSDYRKQGIFSMFLFFLKRNEGMSQIVLGDLHSERTIEALKRIHIRFDTNWVKGDRKIKFDPANVDKFYSDAGPTGWKIMLENDHDFSKCSKFWNYEIGGPCPPLRDFYTSLLLD